MRHAFVLSGSLLVAAMVGHAQSNVALNKPVTLNGLYPTFNVVCGNAMPQPPASNITNGVYLPEQTCYQNGVYWSSDNQSNSLDIDLGGQFLISAATVQADDNDIYTLQYRDPSGAYHTWWNIPVAGTFGLITRPDPTDSTVRQPLPPVLATGLRFFAPAGSGDNYYAVSQIAVFGVAAPALDTPFQVSYAANPAAGESYINIVNTGANGNNLLGPGFGTKLGNLCVNVYAFSPDEQEISCCSCLLTPNSVANLGVSRDLTSTTLTGVIPTSVVIKLVSTLAGGDGTGASCSNSAALPGTPVVGMVAYGTTPQPSGFGYSAVEHTFVSSTLSASEYASITGRCASIIGNGSGFGICGSCRSGALGATKK